MTTLEKASFVDLPGEIIGHELKARLAAAERDRPPGGYPAFHVTGVIETKDDEV